MAETVVTEALWIRLTEALGLPADADAETTVAAIEDLVTTPAASDAATVAAAAAAAGLTTLDAGTVEQLQADAQEGRTIAAAARKRQVSEVVQAAVGKGKIPPARQAHWVTLITADPKMADTLASMPDNLVPLIEIGHSSDAPHVVDTADWFR